MLPYTEHVGPSWGDFPASLKHSCNQQLMGSRSNRMPLSVIVQIQMYSTTKFSLTNSTSWLWPMSCQFSIKRVSGTEPCSKASMLFILYCQGDSFHFLIRSLSTQSVVNKQQKNFSLQLQYHTTQTTECSPLITFSKSCKTKHFNCVISNKYINNCVI